MIGRIPGARLLLTLLARVLTVLALIGTGARLLPSRFADWPFLPELVSLTPWFALVAALALVLALTTRRWLTALLALASLSAGVGWVYPFFAADHDLPKRAIVAGSSEQPLTDDDAARVMTVNVYKGRADAQAIVQAVRANRVEVLALQETTDEFVDRLNRAGIKEVLPYAKIASADHKYGNGLWSASPLGSPARDDVNSSASQMPAGTVTFGGGREVRFVCVHTTSPSPGEWGQWKRSLDELSAMKAHVHTTYVFMGDFNASYDHAPFRDFLGDRFQDAARYSGHGLTMTWPADRARTPLFTAIDHIVIDQGIQAGQLKTLPIPGSDHRGLVGSIWVGR
ncbi:endonuclease/exonuclease/phosphatase family protein [Bifidobacterium actinocoloniiforme]|uniref:endonuclease/exonuclease/phosphatase family protein n=1 Tax=Bifidobacterium actinocoloniiforme TaxID=638619 RepID=UPI001F28C9E1|nr:endonuclease/exonuclease/phosphatase family protein [Bifidobacterium actinocoloniiforme]